MNFSNAASANLPNPVRQSPAITLGSALPLILFAAYLLQCAWFTRTQSLTYDEPVHIAEGLDAWRNHRFEKWNDHPSLARLWLTLPLLDSRWQMNVEPLPTEGWRVASLAPDAISIANRVRCMNVVLGLLLAVLLWITAKRLFSQAAGTLALALFVCSPALVAHFSLATTDGAATLLTFATAAYLVRWRTRQTAFPTVCLGVLLGLLLLAKFSTPVMFVVAAFWMLVLSPVRLIVNPLRWNFLKTLAAIVVAALVVWAGYFFHVSRLTIRDHHLTVSFPNRPTVVYDNVHTSMNLNVIVPAGEYFEGLRNVVRRNRLGQRSFFWGRVSARGGFRLYYPAVVLLKWPLVTLCFLALTAVLVCLKKLPLTTDLAIMASFPVIYFLVAVSARFDIGDRHILPVYPFALLFSAGAAEFARKHRTGNVILAAALLLGSADLLRYAPDDLSYFNIFVRPSSSYKLLTDSNLDWGQGLLALRDYQKFHPSERISLAYFGSVDPAAYGIHARHLAEGERASGTVIVGATHFSGQYLSDPNAYHWVLQYPLTQILNHSLYVFRVPPPPPDPKYPRGLPEI
jgi:hypothetical protein